MNYCNSFFLQNRGPRFWVSCRSKYNFKNKVVEAKEGDTQLTLKELAPVRMLKNKFYNDLQELYTKAPSKEELQQLLGRARAKRGMFEGDLDEGELEIGQIAGLIHDIKPAKQILDEIILEYEQTKQLISTL
jgi:enoyl-[acyl-carrier protein] reductase II